MWIFEIFKRTEDIYYRDFKKTIINLNKHHKITVSVLRTRVQTITNVVNDRKNEYESLKRNDSNNNNSHNLDDLELKIKVIEKLQEESKIDFINGVSIKYRDLHEQEVPCTYEKCIQYSYLVERKYWTTNPNLCNEEINFSDLVLLKIPIS
jgi:hypothetical protein